MGRKTKVNRKPTSKQDKQRKVRATEEEGNISKDGGLWDFVRVIETVGDAVLCDTEGCQCRAVTTWVQDTAPNDMWNTCESCQTADFGGWPEHIDRGNNASAPTIQDQKVTTREEEGRQSKTAIPSTDECATEDTQAPNGNTPSNEKTGKDHERQELENAPNSPVVQRVEREETLTTVEDTTSPMECTTPKQATSLPVVTQTPEETTNSSGDDGEDSYDLKKIISFEDILKDDNICCSSESCDLPYCAIWVSSKEPAEKWYYCIDCQENDFGGWPPMVELPLSHMEPEHVSAIAKKCSVQKKPTMPAFPSQPLNLPASDNREQANSPTSPPNSNVAKDSDSKDPNCHESAKNSSSANSGGSSRAAQPSAKALAMHKKWQEAAESMGGKDARIVVSKPASKKLIFDFLFETFAPMNITQIYKGLKAVVPNIVLDQCLLEMIPDEHRGDGNPFADSDDEESSTRNKTSEPYGGSLLFKAGKNASTCLYYIDHTKLKGLGGDERDALVMESASATAEAASLTTALKDTKTRATQLRSEPTNEALALEFQDKEVRIQELDKKLEEARKLKVNEKHKKSIKRRIETMTSQWRKRRRLCLEFLTCLEENTEGSITRSKCLKGDGPIALDSDTVVAKQAVKMATERRTRPQGSLGIGKRSRGIIGQSKKNASSESLADPSFVAVTLDEQLNVRRVYATGVDK